MTTLQTDPVKIQSPSEEQINAQSEAPPDVRRTARRGKKKSADDETIKAPYDDSNRKFCQPKKSKDRGWYRVEGITGMRLG